MKANDIPWWAPEAVTLRDVLGRVLYASEHPYGLDVFVPVIDRSFMSLGLVPPSRFQVEAVQAFRRAMAEFADAVKVWNGGNPEKEEGR